MDPCLSYEELKKHCVDEHDYVGSMKCGRCHQDLTCQELYQNHVAYCRAPFQYIDCGQTFAKHNSFVYHIELPWCAKLPNYKLLYPQTPKEVSYSFKKRSTAPKKSKNPTRYCLVMKKSSSGCAPRRNLAVKYRKRKKILFTHRKRKKEKIESPVTKVEDESVEVMKRYCVKEKVENRIYF